MFKVGEKVRYRRALDADYTYGTIVELIDNIALIELIGHNRGVVTDVRIKYIERIKKAGVKRGSNRKKHSKRSTTKTKLQ